MINPLALFRAASLHNRAEDAALDQKWKDAAELIAQAIQAYERVGKAKLVPIKALTLSAAIDYRLGRFDQVSATVGRVQRAEPRRWKSLKSADANYIRYFLAELLEYVAGADLPSRSAEHLRQAEEIGSDLSEVDIGKVSPSLLGLFPLTAVEI